MKPSVKALLLLLVVALITGWSGPAQAAMGDVEEFSFRGAESDLLGMEESMKPDGKRDAHFVVSVKGVGAVKGVSMKALGSEREWDTTPGNSSWGMVVRDSQGEELTTSSGSLSIVPYLMFLTLHVYVADDGTAFSEEREYEVSVSFIDGSTATARTTVQGLPEIFREEEEALHDEAMSAILYGKGAKDVVGRSERIAGDGRRDAHFRVRFDTISVVEEIAVRNVDGTSSAWDTVPANGIWVIAVYTDGNLRNRQDGSVRFAVEDETTLDLWVADNGSIDAGSTRYEVIVKFNDGTVMRRIAERPAPVTDTGEGILSAVLHPPGQRDLTARNETLRGDGKTDWKISVELSASGKIISFIVRGDDGASEWDTLPGNGKWLLGVTDASGNVMNENNGSVSINVSGRKNLDLWLTDNGTIAEGDVKYKVITVMSDGTIIEREVVRAGGVRPSPLAPVEIGAVRTSGQVRPVYIGKGPMNYLPKAEVSSLLTPSDANPDAHVRLALSGLEGTIESLAVKAPDGGGGVWDTIRGNGTWNIVVTRTRSGGILSNTDGTFNMAVTGDTELHLWLADNGNFGSAPQRFEVHVTFEDGRVLKNSITE
ncbi:MAG: hypothetical protein ACP5DY_04640 [Thermovirgaceae bacterium]